ncbi:hypothetical protein KKF09_03475 [Patescibacteria group bacterium]|nr:hypothetical protein [Patescibacteria group bacterium]
MNDLPNNKQEEEETSSGDVFTDSSTGVGFQEGNWRALKYYRGPQTPKIVQWVIKYSGGLIKDEKQALYVVFGFIALMIIITLSLVFSENGIRTRKTFTPSDEELMMMEEGMMLPSE